MVQQQSLDREKLLQSVSQDRLMEDVQQIAQWERLSGTEDERQAFEYIESQLRDAGLQTQLIEHEALISLPLDAALKIEDEDGETLDCITHSFAASTHADGLLAPARYVSDFKEERDLTGHIAVIDGLAMPQSVARAEAAGAVGAVFLNRDPHVHEMIVSTVYGSPKPDQLADLPTIPAVSVVGETAERLRERFETNQEPLHLWIQAQVDTGWRKIPLLIADLPGTVEDTFVLFAGHVDSWHYGAMDNGTANATMLEVARLIAKTQPYRGLRLAFWSGHSHGRYAGSAWYADAHWAELDERCAVHVNVDSVGGRNATKLDEGYCMPETKAVGARAVATVSDQTFHGSRVGRAGDQSFLGIGVPSLFMSFSEHPADSPDASRDFAITGLGTGGLGWWWHTPEDTVDKIDPDLLERDAKAYVAAIHELCTSSVLPLDYAATTTALLDQLRSLQDQLAGHFGVSDCVAETESLVQATEQLNDYATRLRESSDVESRQAVNRTLMELGRTLIPVLYTRSGRYDQDPATTIPKLPPLEDAKKLLEMSPDSDEAHAVRVSARRGRNRLFHALRTARRLAESAIAGGT